MSTPEPTEEDFLVPAAGGRSLLLRHAAYAAIAAGLVLLACLAGCAHGPRPCRDEAGVPHLTARVLDDLPAPGPPRNPFTSPPRFSGLPATVLVTVHGGPYPIAGDLTCAIDGTTRFIGAFRLAPLTEQDFFVSVPRRTDGFSTHVSCDMVNLHTISNE